MVNTTGDFGAALNACCAAFNASLCLLTTPYAEHSPRNAAMLGCSVCAERNAVTLSKHIKLQDGK